MQDSKTNKARIDIYSTIYDIDLVVANKYTNIEELKKDYIYSDGVEIEDFPEYTATTSTVRNRHTGRYCVLVRYHRDSKDKSLDKHLDLINTAAHEAYHVMMDIFEACSIKVTYEEQENPAYFIGWATTCILKTWLNK